MPPCLLSNPSVTVHRSIVNCCSVTWHLLVSAPFNHLSMFWFLRISVLGRLTGPPPVLITRSLAEEKTLSQFCIMCRVELLGLPRPSGWLRWCCFLVGLVLKAFICLVSEDFKMSSEEVTVQLAFLYWLRIQGLFPELLSLLCIFSVQVQGKNTDSDAP